MRFSDPFTDDEHAQASRVPITAPILLFALRTGTAGMCAFGDSVLTPLFRGLLKPVDDRENAFGLVFYRLLGWLHSAARLDDSKHFQALCAAARACFELCIDAAILSHDDAVPNAIEKFHAHTEVARFALARLTTRFYDNHPEIREPEDMAERRTAASDSARADALEQRCADLWAVRMSNAPDHWSGLSIVDRCQRLGENYAERQRQYWKFFSWQIHGGGAGVAGLSADAFASIEVICRQTLRESVPEAFRLIGVAVSAHRAVPDFFEKLEFLTAYVEVLAATDARLMSLGRPSRFQDAGSRDSGESLKGAT